MHIHVNDSINNIFNFSIDKPLTNFYITYMTKLNLPSVTNTKENQFEMVSFVNTMSHYSLKVLVKRLWENFHDLANAMENNRNDVTQAIDQILSGEKWSVKNFQSRFSFMIHNGEVIQYDSYNNEFTVLAVVDGEWAKSAPTKAMSYDELLKTIKKG